MFTELDSNGVIYGDSLLPRLLLSQEHHLVSLLGILCFPQVHLPFCLLFCSPAWTAAPGAGSLQLPFTPSHPSLDTVTVSTRSLPFYTTCLGVLKSHCLYLLLPPCLSAVFPLMRVPATSLVAQLHFFLFQISQDIQLFKRTFKANSLVRHSFLYLLPTQAHN